MDVKDFTQGWRERLCNPIIPAFVIAFVIWNWRAVIYLVADLPPGEKIDSIARLIDRPSFGGPAVFAVVYVLIAPLVARLAVIWREFIRGVWENRVIAWQSNNDVYRDEATFKATCKSLTSVGFTEPESFVLVAAGVRDHNLHRLTGREMSGLEGVVAKIWRIAAAHGNTDARSHLGQESDHDAVMLLRSFFLRVQTHNIRMTKIAEMDSEPGSAGWEDFHKTHCVATGRESKFLEDRLGAMAHFDPDDLDESTPDVAE
jgi:hypothetical protein